LATDPKTTIEQVTFEGGESDSTERSAAETAEIIGSTSDSPFDRRQNGAKQSTAENTAAWSSSEERRKLQVNGNCDEGTELSRRTIVERTEEVSKDVDGSSDESETEIISLEKGVYGLGFCIEGGRDCPSGRAPVTVKRLFRGELISGFFTATSYVLLVHIDCASIIADNRTRIKLSCCCNSRLYCIYDVLYYFNS